MKAHVNNSYIRKIHNNTTLIVRNVFVFYLKNNYCFFGKKNPWRPRGGQLSQNKKRNRGKSFQGRPREPLGCYS